MHSLYEIRSIESSKVFQSKANIFRRISHVQNVLKGERVRRACTMGAPPPSACSRKRERERELLRVKLPGGRRSASRSLAAQQASQLAKSAQPVVQPRFSTCSVCGCCYARRHRPPLEPTPTLLS